MYSICYYREETTIARSCVQPEHDNNNNCHNCYIRTTSALRTTPALRATSALWPTPALRATTKGVSERKGGMKMREK